MKEKNGRFLFLLFVVFGLIVAYLVHYNETKIDKLKMEVYGCEEWTEDSYLSFDDSDIVDDVLATKYNPVEEQCDSTPLITADNSKIDLNKLSNHELRWIAISRDLRSRYNYGDTVVVISDNPLLDGEWVVRDTMNPRFNKRIDFLVPENDKYNFNSPINVTIYKKKEAI